MAKYLMLWELNRALIPIDPHERAQGFGALMEFVQKDIEVGLTKDWGVFCW